MQKENIYVTNKSSLRDDRNLTKFDTLDEKISELVRALLGGAGGQDGTVADRKQFHQLRWP